MEFQIFVNVLSMTTSPPGQLPHFQQDHGNVTQPFNNWKHGFRFITLEHLRRSCKGYSRCHATVLF